jgi:hypothetical protein
MLQRDQGSALSVNNLGVLRLFFVQQDFPRGCPGSRARRSLRNTEVARFALDSLLEESGFEPLVPLATEVLIELARGISNPTRMLAVGDIGPVPRLC